MIRASRRRPRRQRRRRDRLGPLVALFSAVVALSVLGLFLSFGYAYAKVSRDLPVLSQYQTTSLAQTSTVYDARGNVVDELHGGQNRFVVPLDKISPNLQKAVISIEDRRFYEHRGVDFEAIFRAAVEDVRTMSIQEGGSTITQQLIKNTYIDPQARAIPSFERKITEASLAWQYEKDHTKQQILEQYLNTVFFGANAYGAEAAARTYYSKSAKDLDLQESAMLAGIINLPGAYDPFKDPDNAQKRRNVVLDKMLEYGQITAAEHNQAVKQPLGLNRGRIEYKDDNQYFLDAVRQELAKEYGDQMLYEGGLRIYTTLDPDLQRMASQAVHSVVDPKAGDPSAALVSVEPSTGAVKALVGGSDYSEVKFNLATQGQRQPGSSFKMFVLADAIKQGVSTETRYDSKSLNIDMGPGSQPYKVQNYGLIQRGPITIKKATEQSDNTVFVQLALDLGLQSVVSTAHKMGITSELDPYPATAIGGLRVGVTPLEMASAYSTLANHGEQAKPYLITKVTRVENGKEAILKEHKLAVERALTRDEAAAVTQTLRGVVTQGTASYYHNLNAELGRPSAGKTGTTEDFVDAWFVGYVPQLATSVWVGYPGSRKSMVNIRGYSEINGENFPLDIWSAYMKQAVQDFPVEAFDTPSPALKLKIKKDGRTYKEPERPKVIITVPDEETDTGQGGTTDSTVPATQPAPVTKPKPAKPWGGGTNSLPPVPGWLQQP